PPPPLHSLQLSDRLVKESSGRRGRRSNGDGQEGKPRKKRGSESKSGLLDGDGASLSPSSKPHICEHCNAAFRSSYHLRRHVLIHTGKTSLLLIFRDLRLLVSLSENVVLVSLVKGGWE
ncbi:zinc finger protein 281-like isoform X2, partial [Arapaima gigas]